MQAPAAELPSVGRKAPAPSGETKSKNTSSPLIFESAGKSTRSRAADSWLTPRSLLPRRFFEIRKMERRGYGASRESPPPRHERLGVREHTRLACKPSGPQAISRPGGIQLHSPMSTYTRTELRSSNLHARGVCFSALRHQLDMRPELFPPP
jgi:hypothetical protein